MIINIINKDSRASYFLDLIRFLMALIVVLFHMGIEILPGYNAVMVFFVLSGYFISSNISKKMINNTFSWKEYLLERLVRLYIVLIPSLFLGFLLIYIDIQWFGNENKYMGYLNLNLLVNDILYLQFLDTKMFAYNGPLWSLAYEFWFYLLFPSIMSIFYYKDLKIKILFVGISVSIFIFTFKMQAYFLIWLLGVIPVVIHLNPFFIKNIKILNRISLAIFLFSLSLLYYNYNTNHIASIENHYFYSLFVAIATSLFIITLLGRFNNVKAKGTFFNLIRIGSASSFSMYLLHYPLLHFMADLKTYIEISIGFHYFIFSVVWYLLILISIIVYSYMVSLVTEAKTVNVKLFLASKLKKVSMFKETK